MKTFFAVVLCLALVVSESTVFALSGSMTNFKKIQTYKEQFLDASKSDWYGKDIINLFELGIIEELSEGSGWGRANNGQLIELAARIRCIYDGGDPDSIEPIKEKLRYTGYVDYLKKCGVDLGYFDGKLNVLATRIDAAYLFGSILPAKEFEVKNKEIKTLLDVSSDCEGYENTLMLYRAGVLTGIDKYGTFAPNEMIWTQEALIIINRVIEKSARKKTQFEEKMLMKPTKKYNGQYKDVKSSAWYYEDVKALYSYGLTEKLCGKDFEPNKSLCVGEAVALAEMIKSKYEGVELGFTPGNAKPWYTPYVLNAVSECVVQSFEKYLRAPETPINRSDFILIYSRLIPESELYPLSESISMVPSTHYETYGYDAILLFYQSGVLQGRDRIGSFYPMESITRAEAAAVIHRMLHPSQRKTIST